MYHICSHSHTTIYTYITLIGGEDKCVFQWKLDGVVDDSVVINRKVHKQHQSLGKNIPIIIITIMMFDLSNNFHVML